MDMNAVGTRFYINDVGQGAYEEVDDGQAGVDYGWSCREGRHSNSSSGPCTSAGTLGLVDPVYEYPRGTIPGTTVTGCASITGGLRFSGWSDAGARSHNYIVPNTSATLTANFTVGSFVPSLDIDNDGDFDAATDGVLLLRYLLEMRDAALTAGAIGTNAERNATTIASYIAALGIALDVDGDSSVKALSDGLLAIRYLLNVRGAALISGAKATAASAATIEANLQALLP